MKASTHAMLDMLPAGIAGEVKLAIARTGLTSALEMAINRLTCIISADPLTIERWLRMRAEVDRNTAHQPEVESRRLHAYLPS